MRWDGSNGGAFFASLFCKGPILALSVPRFVHEKAPPFLFPKSYCTAGNAPRLVTFTQQEHEGLHTSDGRVEQDGARWIFWRKRILLHFFRSLGPQRSLWTRHAAALGLIWQGSHAVPAQCRSVSLLAPMPSAEIGAKTALELQ